MSIPTRRRIRQLELRRRLAAGAVLTTIIGLSALAAVWLLGPHSRMVQVLVTGVSQDAELTLRLGGRSATSKRGSLYEFAEVEVGATTLEWVLGPECGLTCPGESCPGWCVSDAEELEITSGSEPQVVPLQLQLPAPREVVVQVEPDWGRVRVELGDRVFEGIGEVDLGALALGPHTLEVSAEGSTWQGVLELVPGEGPLRFPAPLPAPPEASAPPPARAVLAASLPVPAEAPAPEPLPKAPGSGQVITRGQFAGWVSEHPTWSRSEAIAARRADDNYLRQGSLEGEGYIADVSWLAAVAYCSEHGGLAPLDAEPLSWSEDGGQPFHEWRLDGTNPSWRRFDGETSRAAGRTEANAFTGFRCAR